MNSQRLARGLTMLLLTAGPALGQAVDSNIGVSSFAQQRGNPCSGGRGSAGCGGCYPGAIDTSDPTSLLATVNPEWQPVGPMISGPGGDPTLPPDSQPVLFTGTVALSKINIGGDFPASHITTDQNTFITLDADKAGLLATGNNPAGCSGEGCNQIEMEREVVKYPLFAWADEGDRIAALGRWIFDCGHPDQNPPGKCSNSASTSCAIDTDCPAGGTCTSPAPNFNYRAELHPPQAIAVMRNKNQGKTPATRADVYISADGGGAGDRCTVTHLTSFLEVLSAKACFVNKCSVTTTQTCLTDSDCPKKETCVKLDPTQSVLDINKSDFEFDMPLPTKPAGATDVKIKATKMKVPKGTIMPNATFVNHLDAPTPSIHVTVPMSVPIKGKMPNLFAQSISAAWKKDPTKLTQVQVAFTGLTINNPLKPKTPVIARQCTNVSGGGLSGTPCTTSADCPTGAQCVGGTPAGWEIFAQANGDWVKLTGLDTITVDTAASTAIKEKSKLTEVVPSDGAIHIFALGHSLNCIDSLYGHNLLEGLNIYGFTLGADCLQNGMDPDPGRIDLRHTGTGFATTTGTPTTCTTSGKLMSCTATSSGGDAGTCSGSGGACLTNADCGTGETCNVTGSAFTLQYTLKTM